VPKALLVYPKNPVTFWSFDEALKITKKKSAYPSLGLLTIAGMLPDYYELRHIDLNVRCLNDEDIAWADIVMTSSMIIHWHSLEEIIARCNILRTPVLNGGPLPTQYFNDLAGNATFYLGEAENGFVDVIERLIENGYDNKREYIDCRGKFNSMVKTPTPRWDLIDLNNYSAMVIQLTRGCPESCTFCNIPSLYGKITRIREKEHALQEFKALYEVGWRGSVMAVDDNFVGNSEAICDLLEESIIPWQQAHNYPFNLVTQASIRVSDNPRLLGAMHLGGFSQIFCGIESPANESLKFMGAQKNLQGKMSLLEKVSLLQSYGFEVMAGFIIGFDTDPDDIAERMIDFIQKSGIPTAMVGILGVLPDTPDYKRFKKSGRLIEGVKYTGDAGLFSRVLSFIPAIEPDELFARHRRVVETVNAPQNYFKRCLTFFEHCHQEQCYNRPINWYTVKTIIRVIWKQGVMSDYKAEYWKFLSRVILRHPRKLADALRLAVWGHHFIKTTAEALQLDNISSFLKTSLRSFEEYCSGDHEAFQVDKLTYTHQLFQIVQKRFKNSKNDLQELKYNGQILVELAEQQCFMLRKDYRNQINKALVQFSNNIEQILLRNPQQRSEAVPLC